MSTPSKEFFSPPTLMPPAGYSHLAKVNRGTIVYLAGQVSSDASGKLIGEGNFEAQVEQVFGNLKIALDAAGGTMADIVPLTLYFVNRDDAAGYFEIAERFFGTNPPPATGVVVAGLLLPGLLIEINAQAVFAT